MILDFNLLFFFPRFNDLMKFVLIEKKKKKLCKYFIFFNVIKVEWFQTWYMQKGLRFLRTIYHKGFFILFHTPSFKLQISFYKLGRGFWFLLTHGSKTVKKFSVNEEKKSFSGIFWCFTGKVFSEALYIWEVFKYFSVR